MITTIFLSKKQHDGTFPSQTFTFVYTRSFLVARYRIPEPLSSTFIRSWLHQGILTWLRLLLKNHHHQSQTIMLFIWRQVCQIRSCPTCQSEVLHRRSTSYVYNFTWLYTNCHVLILSFRWAFTHISGSNGIRIKRSSQLGCFSWHSQRWTFNGHEQ